MSKSNFWRLDFDLEGEIYENPAWDLPGLRRTHGLHPNQSRDRNKVADISHATARGHKPVQKSTIA